MRSLILAGLIAGFAQAALAVPVNNDPQAAADAAAAFEAAKQGQERNNEDVQEKFMVTVLNVATQKFAEGIAGLYNDRVESIVVTPSIPAGDSPADISSVGYATMDGRTCEITIQMSQKVLPLKAHASCVPLGSNTPEEIEGGSPAFNLRLIQAIFTGMRTGHVNPEDFTIDIKR